MHRLGQGMVRMVAICLLAGCTRLPDARHTPQDTKGQASVEPSLDALRKNADLETCRNLTQQINAYLDRHPGKRPASLSAEQRDRLASDFGLDADEIKEVGSSSFTLLDAHYLEQSILLHEAARSLYLDKLTAPQKVEAAFAWVIRQVRLRDKDAETAPPAYVLRRGWGSPRERALVFLALLDQLDIPGCMIGIPDGPGFRPWFPGALVDGRILLFDTRLGGPLSVAGEASTALATLTDLRQRPEAVLAHLPEDRDNPSAEHARRAEARAACSLSALATRMQYLQTRLGPAGPRVAVAPDRLAAGGVQGIWKAAEPGTSLRVLRSFLPPAQGGGDGGLLVPEVGLRSFRKHRFEAQLFPSDLVPLFRDTPEMVRLFAEPFLLLSAPAPGGNATTASATSFIAVTCTHCGKGQELPDRWEGKPVQWEGQTVKCKDCGADFTVTGGRPFERADESLLRLLRAPWGARDYLVRGQFTEATAKLMETRERAEQLEAAVRNDPELKPIREVNVALQQALRETKNPTALESARARFRALDQRSQQPLKFLLGQAASPLAAESVYLLALCKQEEAERLHGVNAGAAWTAAAEAWRRYLDEYAGGSGQVAGGASAASARQMRAHALKKLGRREEAIALLENLPPQIDGWNRKACLHQARTLKGQ